MNMLTEVLRGFGQGIGREVGKRFFFNGHYNVEPAWWVIRYLEVGVEL